MNPNSHDESAVLDWINEGNPNFAEDVLALMERADLPCLNLKPKTAGTSIYDILAHYQLSTEWRHRELAAELHRWAVIFNAEFDLGVLAVALRIDWLSWRRLGHFRPGHNGFGLKGEIALNERYLSQREPWQVLGTVLHELLHAWQQEHGKPGKPPYHNKEFRNKALEYGLVIDENGVTQYLPDSVFKDLLTRHGINVPKHPLPPQHRVGNSRLKKWQCRCPVNVRVAVAEFHARCLGCGEIFVRCD